MGISQAQSNPPISSHHSRRLPRLDIVDPPTEPNVLLDRFDPQPLYILLDLDLQIAERPEVEGLHLSRGYLSPLLHDHGFRSRVVECEHTAAGVLYDDDFSCTEELLRYDDGSERVVYTAAGVADYVGGSERYAKGGSWVDARVHTCY